MELDGFRAEIDALDETIVRALARRVAVCRDVAEFKARTSTPMMQPGRVTAVKQRAAALGERYGLSPDLVVSLYDLVVDETCRVEDELIDALTSTPPGPAPILVGGDNRSGTTLVSVVLDSHPDLVVGPELDFTEPPDLGPHLRECCRLLLADDPRVRGRGVTAADPGLAAGVQFARQALRCGVGYDLLDRLAAAAMQRTGSDLRTYQERLVLIDSIGDATRTATGKPRWGRKIQREITRARDLLARWPGARIVHVVRDGRDVAASQLTGGFDWGYRDVTEAATGWSELVDTVRGTVPAASLYELRYEDLVADPEPTLRGLLAFLDVPWDPAVLRHTDAEHSLLANPFDHPSAEAVRQPIHREASGRYRRDLSAEAVAIFERIAGDSLSRLGYERVVAPA